jgi:hypothetical protein
MGAAVILLLRVLRPERWQHQPSARQLRALIEDAKGKPWADSDGSTPRDDATRPTRR